MRSDLVYGITRILRDLDTRGYVDLSFLWDLILGVFFLILDTIILTAIIAGIVAAIFKNDKVKFKEIFSNTFEKIIFYVFIFEIIFLFI